MNTIELISASAGTGKTYRLTELIVEAVRTGVPPERIMATTDRKSTRLNSSHYS